MATVQVLYASTSGHTQYVVSTLCEFLKSQKPDLQVELLRIELAKAEDLAKGDLLILASSTWNTGGAEGQLNPHMFLFVNDRAKDADLAGKKTAVIGLGDQRYRYTARAADHLETFVTSHGGIIAVPTLRVVNEPYGQEEKVKEWGTQLLSMLSSLRA